MIFKQINTFRNYFKVLHDAPIDELTLGFVMGMFIGLLPVSINSFIITLLLFFLKTDKTMGLLSAALFGSLGVWIDPVAHWLGLKVLVDAQFLKPLWTVLYNMPLMPITGFNNTIVMGNTLIGVILTIPMFILVKQSLLKYRSSNLKEKLHKTIIDNKKVNIFSGITDWFEKLKGYFHV
jgi:uncharacterized protein (TIGR03546 family)